LNTFATAREHICNNNNNTTPDLTEVGINHGSNTNHGKNSKAGTGTPKKSNKNLAPIQSASTNNNDTVVVKVHGFL
jgi:hypothetical protein